MLEAGAGLFVNVERLPVHVRSAGQTEVNHARTNRTIGDTIYKNKRPCISVLSVGIEHD